MSNLCGICNIGYNCWNWICLWIIITFNQNPKGLLFTNTNSIWGLLITDIAIFIVYGFIYLFIYLSKRFSVCVRKYQNANGTNSNKAIRDIGKNNNWILISQFIFEEVFFYLSAFLSVLIPLLLPIRFSSHWKHLCIWFNVVPSWRWSSHCVDFYYYFVRSFFCFSFFFHEF